MWNMSRLHIGLMAALLPVMAWSVCTEPVDGSTLKSRFKKQGATVLDQQTGLEWDRCSLGQAWDGKNCQGNAQLVTLDVAQAEAVKRGTGWKVPHIDELYTLVDASCGMPATDTSVFFGIEDFGDGAPYWSQTPIAEMPSLLYYVDFLDGSVDGHTPGFSLAVRLVRSAGKTQKPQ